MLLNSDIEQCAPADLLRKTASECAVSVSLMETDFASQNHYARRSGGSPYMLCGDIK